MEPLLLARWQFGVTTAYHYIVVPLTIGLVGSASATTDALRRRRRPGADGR